MAIQGSTLLNYLEKIAPPNLAIENDRIGLQLGSLQQEVTGVLIALEVTETVIDEAISQGVNWIFAHHALIFQPLRSIRTDQPRGRMLQKLIQNNIQVYVAHTNLDTAEFGVNDVLANELGLQQLSTFLVHGDEPYLKLAVYVPATHVEEVRTAISEKGAGAIGAYTHCTFSTKGTGTFLAGDDTNPFIGKPGELSKVEEYRLETILPKSIQSQVLDTLFSVHPYEEVAYDLFPLSQSKTFGMGKIGMLPFETTLQGFVTHVKNAYQLKHVQVVGDLNTKIEKVAILGGAGSRYVAEAKRQGVDVYITGDIDYHTAQAALEEGICLIDIGHATEQRVIPSVCHQLKQYINEVPIVPSQVDFNPFQVC